MIAIQRNGSPSLSQIEERYRILHCRPHDVVDVHALVTRFQSVLAILDRWSWRDRFLPERTLRISETVAARR
ncbi:MAG: hypothetical protein M3176_02355 [Chloroflexota bacterium]|nr:hypothetical protein [Chloroflexota bacterium]